MNPRTARIKRKPKRQVKTRKTKLKEKANALLQAINRAEHEHCEECGELNEVGHHFIMVSHCADLRYDMENVIPLCTVCHFLHHLGKPCLDVPITRRHGDEWRDRLERLRLEAHERLNTPEQTKTNIAYYLEVIERLEARLGAEVV